MQSQDTEIGCATARPRLSKREIDRRIESVLAEIFADGRRGEAGDLAPRWISAAEIVRRVGPLLSRN